MVSRVALLVLAAFWLTMNVLLWRAEFGADSELGGPVPVELVWEKLLRAPDESYLAIFRHGQRIGFCKWSTSASDALNRLSEDSPLPDAETPADTGLQLRLDGSLALEGHDQRLRFEGGVELGTNQSWERLWLRVTLPPASWDVQAVAATQTVRFVEDDGEERSEKEFKFQELAQPDRFLPGAWALFGGVLPAGLSPRSPATPLTLGLRWEARQASLPIGTTPVRVFRVQTRLLDKYPVVLFVSRAGQVLRLELPIGLLLLDDRLTNL